MKQPQQITPVEAKTTFVDVWRWGAGTRPLPWALFDFLQSSDLRTSFDESVTTDSCCLETSSSAFG